jgi:hypothetical protein
MECDLIFTMYINRRRKILNSMQHTLLPFMDLENDYMDIIIWQVSDYWGHERYQVMGM